MRRVDRAATVLVSALALVAAAFAPLGCGGTEPSVDCDAAGVICSKVGTGESAFNTTVLPARSSKLYLPARLAFDAQGRLYMTDLNNHRVRRVEADSLLTTFAGSGLPFGTLPTGTAPATDVPMYHPSGLAFDAQGNLYVSIYHSYVVVRVTPQDSLTVIAGTGEGGLSGDDGPARDAQVNQPRGLAVDAAGNLYIADTENHRIRKVDTGGTITTLAGNTAGFGGDAGPVSGALFSSPFAVTRALDGRLIVADWGNNRIRALDLVADTVTTLAGNGVRTYGGDGGPATQASLNHPEDAFVAPDGTLYIADSGNHCVRRVALDGTISTVAGTGQSPGRSGDGGPATAAHLDGPGGIALDPQGNLWIADTSNNLVRRVILH